MKYEEALTAEIGDTLKSAFTNTYTHKGDEVILVERARDFNGLTNDTGGWFYHRANKKCFGGNIQDFDLI